MSRAIDTIIVHCSASPNGRRVTVEDIDRWHAERGYVRRAPAIARFNPGLKSIGYHFVIYVNGAIATGRGLEEIGSHARGYNANSVGTCVIGSERFTPMQWIALKANVEALLKRYPGAKVMGHRDVNPDKTCPGFDVTAWIASGMESPTAHILKETSK